MTISDLKYFPLNQNGYHKNIQTKEKVGILYICPVDYTPDDCLSCEGYSLQISDYTDLYKVIGTKFNKTGDAAGTFRVPDYNITGRFLQPGNNAGIQIEAGLPNITGAIYTATVNSIGTASGAFTFGSWNYGTNESPGGSGCCFSFDASRSSSIFGGSTTVQPPSQLVHICIKYT